MRLLLVQLGDIHIETPKDVVFNRKSCVIDAIKNIDSGVSAIVFILSGDTTYSGTEEQYLLALDFIEFIKTSLVQHVSEKCLIHFVTVPGNHDSDFSESTHARNILLDAVEKSPLKILDNSVLNILLSPQRFFFQFRDSVDTLPKVECENVDSRIYTEYELSVDNEKILFCCCNSAVMSQIHEKPGTLIFPHSVLPKNRESVSISIGVIHHPVNWMTPNAGKKFRNTFESITDIIITGHEHAANRRNVSTNKSVTSYYEGGVLQETGDPDSSDFYAILIDTETKKQCVFHFGWSNTLYECLNSGDPKLYHQWEDFAKNPYRIRTTFIINPNFKAYLDDPEVTLTHRTKGLLSLSDIYVYPDLKKLNIAGEKSNTVIKGTSVLKLVDEKACIFVVGDDLSGKTALAKRLFVELRALGDVPVLIDGEKLGSSFDNIDHLVEDSFCKNYESSALNHYRQLDRGKRVVLVDNYNKLKLSDRSKIELLQSLRIHSFRLVVFSHDLELSFNDMAESADSSLGELPFTFYSILPFGLVNRNLFVEQWLMLDSTVQHDVSRFAHNLESLNRVIDTLVGKNYVPAYPCYLLAVLQATEMGADIDTRESTHGYLYELFIKTTIAKRVSPGVFNTISVLLSYLAFWMYEQQLKHIGKTEFRKLHDDLQIQIEVLPEFEIATRQLTELHVINHDNDSYSFRHSYIYYYYLAIYLRDQLSEEEFVGHARVLSKELYKEDNANTMLFLCHLSKKAPLLDMLVESADSQFKDVPLANIGTDIAFLNTLYGTVSHLRLPNGSAQKLRNQVLEDLDAARNQEIVFEEEKRHELENEASMLGKLNAALKTIQIVGQFLKNFPADLNRSEKDRVINSCSGLGRRALSSFLGMVEKNETEILEEMIFLIGRKKSGIDPLKVRERAVTAVVALCDLASYGFVYRISNALGSRELSATYNRVFSETETPIMKLVYVSLQLDHYDDFPESQVLKLGKELRNNPFAFRLLRALVVRYLTLFPTNFRLKQHLSDLLNLSFGSELSGVQLLVGDGVHDTSQSKYIS